MASVVKCSSLFVRQSPSSNGSSAKVETTAVSAIDDRQPTTVATVTRTAPEPHCVPSRAFDRSKFSTVTSEKLKLMPDVAHHRSGPTSKFRHTYHSHRSLNDQDGTREPVWIKRRVSNSAVEKIFDRGNRLFSKEMIDVTV